MNTVVSVPADPAALPLLDVHGLRVSFAGREVVRGIDFCIAPGEKLALVGESGSGKTVSALSLLGLVQGATVQGCAVLQGSAPNNQPVDLLSLPERALQAIRGRDIAMIFQEPMTALNPLFTIGEQIAEVLQKKNGLSPRGVCTGRYSINSRNRHRGGPTAGQGLPTPALWRAAAACHDRHGPGLQAPTAVSRRAHHSA